MHLLEIAAVFLPGGRPLVDDRSFHFKPAEGHPRLPILLRERIVEAARIARELAAVNPGGGCYEIRPVMVINPVHSGLLPSSRAT